MFVYGSHDVTPRWGAMVAVVADRVEFGGGVSLCGDILRVESRLAVREFGCDVSFYYDSCVSHMSLPPGGRFGTARRSSAV